MRWSKCQHLAGLSTLFLAACSQAPQPKPAAVVEVEPMTTAVFDWVRPDLLHHSQRVEVTSNDSYLGVVPGDCESYREGITDYGLPVETFLVIAWRESWCDHTVRLIDDDDTGGGLFGFNLRGSLAGYWHDLCGLTWDNLAESVDRQLDCAAKAYQQLGLEPWENTAP